MSEEKKPKNAEQDIEIAVLTNEFRHIVESVDSMKCEFIEKMKTLNDDVKIFISIADRKLDRETYLADRLEQNVGFSKIQDRVKVLEDAHSTMKIKQEAVQNDRKKIFGLSQSTIAFAISILTLLSLLANKLSSLDSI